MLGGNSQAQEAQQRELAEARRAIQQYRPEAMQARINAFNNASSSYQGANNALQTMYGGRPPAQTPGQRIGAQFTPQRAMGHEIPESAYAPRPEQQQRRPRLGEGNGWEDTAAVMIDPAGIFRSWF
jgi:hypothetical protein